MSNVRHLISDIIHHTSDMWHQMPDISNLTLDFWLKTSTARHMISDIVHITHQTSSIWHQTSDNWDQASNRRQRSDIWHKTSDIRHVTSDVWDQISDISCLTSDVWRQTSELTFSLMKTALPKRRSFICNYQRLTYHLPTFNTAIECRLCYCPKQWRIACSSMVLLSDVLSCSFSVNRLCAVIRD